VAAAAARHYYDPWTKMAEGSGGPIAVVEDDDTARTALGRLLDAAGFEPALFESAETFLTTKPDREWICLIVDVQLTGMSGLDLQQTLRSERAEAPVIIITAKGTDAIRERAERAGCVAFLTKPFHADTILSLVGALANQPRP
jgi:FixJ family two-component response regulator